MSSIEPIRARDRGWEVPAIGEMVFRFLEIPAAERAQEYQCGIVGTMMPKGRRETCTRECAECQLSSGSIVDFKTLFEQYPRRIGRQSGDVVPSVTAKIEPQALTPARVRVEMVQHQVVLALLHSARGIPRPLLIVSWRDSDEELQLLVIDPAFDSSDKFWLDAQATPGRRAGTWWVQYSTLRMQLGWDSTIVVSVEAEGDIPNPPTRAPAGS